MVEINEAYATLTRDGGAAARRSRAGGAGGGTASDFTGSAGTSTGAGRGGPLRTRPTRPVTGRVDTTGTVRPRNQPIRPATADGRASGPVLRGQPPYRVPAIEREPPRASTPTGPLRRARLRNFRRPAGPPLPDALDVELAFGKFHGHTLGQVAAFEPSYIDWLATTITRDRDLVSAARVVREDLDRRGVVRRARPAPAVDRSGRSA
jgi:hypothetical protein